MRGKLGGLTLVVGAALASYAGPVSGAASRCQVCDAGKLPGGSSPAAICAEIERAVAAASPHADYSVLVTVVSPSRLSAVATVNGRALPQQNFAVMDQNLNPGSVRRFAKSLAAEIAKVAKE